jgi:Protein of unknown function (DUF3122)
VWRRILQGLIWFILLIAIIAFLFLGVETLISHPVIAAVIQIEETPGHILYRSQHSLKDESGHAWQVVLFKQVHSTLEDQNNVVSLSLRVVGLPGAAEVAHPTTLKIATDTGKVFTAPDMFWEDAPAPTIGQYNFQEVAAQLPVEDLVLAIPLVDHPYVNLRVPQAVVQEWQEVVAQTPGY